MNDYRLFDTGSGNSVTVALDHGLSLGSVEGFRRPAETLQRVLDGEPDSVLIGPHFARRFHDQLASTDVDVAVTCDVVTFSTRPGADEDQDIWTPAFDTESILELDPAAVKMVLVFGRDDRELFAENIEAVSRTADALRGTGVPFMVEPVMWGSRVPDGYETDPEQIRKASRMAWEFGADILKVPYTGDVDTFQEVVAESPVPVMILGGPATSSTADVLRDIEGSMAAGARGLVMGRSIWKAEETTRLIQAINRIVHDGAAADEVW